MACVSALITAVVSIEFLAVQLHLSYDCKRPYEHYDNHDKNGDLEGLAQSFLWWR